MLVVDHLHTGHSRGSLLCKVWGFLPWGSSFLFPHFLLMPSPSYPPDPSLNIKSTKGLFKNLWKCIMTSGDQQCYPWKHWYSSIAFREWKGGGGIKEEVRGRDVVWLIWHNGFILCSLHGITYQLVQPFIMFHLLSRNSGIKTKYTFQNTSRSLLWWKSYHWWPWKPAHMLTKEILCEFHC